MQSADAKDKWINENYFYREGLKTRNKMLKIFCALAYLLFGILSIECFASGWTNSVKVLEIYSLSSTQTIVKLSAFNNPDNCQINNDGQVIFNPSTNKEFFSIFLAAYASEKKVSVFVSDSCIPVWPQTSFAEVMHVKAIGQ